MKSFSNSFTLPNGKKYRLKEINNRDYLSLIKYSTASDKEGFFTLLDSLIEETIEDFFSLDIIEKIYIYIAFYYFSVRGNILVNNPTLGGQEIYLDIILNNIEKCWKKDSINVKLNEKISCSVSIPKTFNIENENVFVNYNSGIEKINSLSLTEEQIKKILNIDSKYSLMIDNECRKRLKCECDIFEGVPLMKYKINLISSTMIDFVFSIYNESRDSFYNKLYTSIQYLKLDAESFMNLTPFETEYLINTLIKDKEEQNKKLKESS